jgi:hypothetical protein
MIQWYHSWASTQMNVSQETIDTYTPSFNAALFTMAKLRKQPRCPTTGERINKMWYVWVYVCVFYLAIRSNDMRFEDKWMQLEDIMWSEVSQIQKDKGCMLSLLCER